VSTYSILEQSKGCSLSSTGAWALVMATLALVSALFFVVGRSLRQEWKRWNWSLT
jgi:hypothetical protein